MRYVILNYKTFHKNHRCVRMRPIRKRGGKHLKKNTDFYLLLFQIIYISFSITEIKKKVWFLSSFIHHQNYTISLNCVCVFVCVEVKWVPGPRRGDMAVVSACSGGRVLRWSVDGAESKLSLTAGFALVMQQLPLGRSASRVSVAENQHRSNITEGHGSMSVCLGSNCRGGQFSFV